MKVRSPYTCEAKWFLAAPTKWYVFGPALPSIGLEFIDEQDAKDMAARLNAAYLAGMVDYRARLMGTLGLNTFGGEVRAEPIDFFM